MREDQIDRIKKRSNAIGNSFDEFLKFLGELVDKDGKAFDISRTISGTDSSISDLRARTALIAGLIEKFDDSGKGTALTPLSDFVSMVNAGNAVVNTINQAQETIQNHVQGSGGLQSIDYENLNLMGGNGNAISVQGNLKSLFDAVEAYLQAFQFVFQATNPSRASFNFSSAAKTLSQIISKASDTRDKLNNNLKRSEEHLSELGSQNDKIGKLRNGSEADKNQISELLGRANESVGQISAHNETATQLANASAELQAQIDQYAGSFSEFQSALDSRMKAFKSGNEELDRLRKKFSDQEKSFDELITKSNQMLSSSTVAGLASEFGKIRGELSTETKSSHKSFNFAIGILLLSALPLILFIFSPFIAPFISNDDRIINAIAGISSERNGWQYVGQVLARLVILLPAIWYVTFCSNRYNALFKLKEHYAYKYSMAVAVEGFKKQAPGYEDLVAALVFEQLAFNPADKIGRQKTGPDAPPNPIAKLFSETLRRRFEGKEP